MCSGLSVRVVWTWGHVFVVGLLFSTRIGEWVFVGWGVVPSSPFCRKIFSTHVGTRELRLGEVCLRLLCAGIIFSTRVGACGFVMLVRVLKEYAVLSVCGYYF